MVYINERYKLGAEKRKQTCLQKYGVNTPLKNEKIKDKITQTCLERYGVEKPLQSEQIKTKLKNTNLERYGVEWVQQFPEFRQKLKDTCLEKYGVDNVFKSEVIKNKIKQTYLQKYGVDHPSKSKEWQIRRIRTVYDKAYDNFSRFKDVKPLFSKAEYQGGGKVYKWLKVSINKEFHAVYSGYEPVGQFEYTSVEQFIINLLTSNNIKYEIRKRNIISPYELDFYLPDFNLAIETHGMYYHSTDIMKDIKYNFNKFNLCKEKGIRLIQIFEDEICNKPQIILSRLKHLLKLTKYKIYARKCKIRQIEPSQKDKFLDKYHLQGTCQSKINLGAFFKNRLIAIMTFGKGRKIMNSNKKNILELTRFAAIGKFNVVGIADKLFQHFLRTYNVNKLPIISYQDLCWGEGNLYTKLGFKFEKHTSPGYFYYKNGQRFHRYNFAKHILHKKLEKFDSNKTESENMRNNGYFKIYNTGNAKWIYNVSICSTKCAEN